MSWKSIESAPKDKLIDVWMKRHWSQHKKQDGSLSEHGEWREARRLPNVHWIEDGEDFYGNRGGGWTSFKFFIEKKDVITHWMEIPEPPENS